MRQLRITQQITNRDTESLNKYFSEVNSFPMMSTEEEVKMAKLAREGDTSAIESMVLANLRFVVSVAKQYQSTGELLADLISAGNLGLIEAAKRFDETKGFKFISYAVWWIRQSIVQYISENNKTIRMPSNKIMLNNKLKNISSELEQTLERKPCLPEIIEAFELKFGGNISEKLASEILSFTTSLQSLDAPVSNNEDAGTMHDLISGDSFEEMTRLFKQEDLKSTISRLSKRLSKIESYILFSYYGIGCKEKSLLQLGEELDLTRERVRQIKEKSLRKLKTHSSKKILKEYL